jgi:protein-S-isoprenylcysteine O-methyltransferase Ste14
MMVFALVRALVYSALFIGLVLVFLPARVLAWSGLVRPAHFGSVQLAGLVFGCAGALLAGWCILTFALVGRGTPAPFDPPRRLVIRGAYRLVRNPMYIGAGLALLGAALVYESLPLLLYFLVFWLVTHLFVVWYEEPTLRRSFGAEYEQYSRRVRRWWPAWPSSGGPLMRLLLPACSLIAISGAGIGQLAAQAQESNPRLAASSFATVEVHLNAWRIGSRWYEEDAGLAGPARIAISYGQPHARGRKIEGGLIPMDTVWRFGANLATALHTDVDMRLGTVAVPRGDYSLFLLNGKAGWQLILSRATALWGTDYDPARDLGRVSLTSRKLAEPEESLTMYLVPDARPGSGLAELSGVLRIKWGTTELATTWSVTH